MGCKALFSTGIFFGLADQRVCIGQKLNADLHVPKRMGWLHSQCPLRRSTSVLTLPTLYAIILLSKMLPVFGITCPPKCRCEDLLYYCDSQGLQAVPDNIDKSSLGLSIRHNSITELHSDQFASLTQLTWLHLDHNHITTVHEDSFQGLYKLKELILSSNKLGHLPKATFNQLINLQNLDLSFNQMTSLEPELFNGLRKLQTMHLRSNSLRNIPIRIFWDCRSLEFLDLSHNRLRSLARNGFAGLLKLTELHLEHNQLTKINFAHFPRLISLHTLYLQWNKISNLTCGIMWTWESLKKLDLTNNEVKTIDLTVFETTPNLQTVLLDNNKLTTLDLQILNSWKLLTMVGLSGNLWECSHQICGLATWLSKFRGRWEHPILCHSPAHTQGEDILDAVHGFQLCKNLTATVTSMAVYFTDVTQPMENVTECGTSPTQTTSQTSETHSQTTTNLAVTVGDSDLTEIDNTILTQKVVMGTMALLFSFSLIIFVVYISRKCCPPTLRKIRQCSAIQNHRQLRNPTRSALSDLSSQGAYSEYEPTPEGGSLVIINGYGQCKCQQLPYKECEV
ncbi:leucine-rich repeat transmembrane neuronal protein 2 [Protopterus annectens]|uniref:leucine-rich repeat transmembrane neuronal protein 2 n=1 Tax=Protopterus annectens TaxID=7888 RepID=UPI001CFC39BB|nr:leucine-rich repeat transmembrane neuronal protein 2 [Protopterus annectens]